MCIIIIRIYKDGYILILIFCDDDIFQNNIHRVRVPIIKISNV